MATSRTASVATIMVAAIWAMIVVVAVSGCLLLFD
jgi:hypothetical protein